MRAPVPLEGSDEKPDPQAEALNGFNAGGTELEFVVMFHGCTKVEDFVVDIYTTDR